MVKTSISQVKVRLNTGEVTGWFLKKAGTRQVKRKEMSFNKFFGSVLAWQLITCRVVEIQGEIFGKLSVKSSRQTSLKEQKHFLINTWRQ